MGHPLVKKMYNEEKLYSVRSLVVVHIVNFQRDLFVMRFIHIELIICPTSKVGRVIQGDSFARGPKTIVYK